MLTIQSFVLIHDRGKGEMVFNAATRRCSQFPATVGPGGNQSLKGRGHGIWVARRYNQTRVSDQVGAVAHVRDNAGNAAGHGFCNRVGEGFTPRGR